MLLRVTKVTGGNNAADPRPSFDPPLHACLATADVRVDVGDDDNANVDRDGGGGGGESQLIGGVPYAVVPASPILDNHRHTGEILTVGRKNCTATLEDKCVSRTHATIALLSNREGHGQDAPSAFPLPDDAGRVLMEYGRPTTAEEVRACETSISGTICVVRDMGSKFGTYVSIDESLLAECRPRPRSDDNGDERNDDDGGDDDETGDDATDIDEAGSASMKRIDYVELTEKQGRAVRMLLSDEYRDDSTSTTILPKFKKMEEKKSMPLLQLSHFSSSSSSESRHVILLFGPQGSAVRLSLVPLAFTFSRYKAPALDPIIASLHYVGARHLDQWNVRHSTHLVAPDKTAAAKGIMAWACRRPVVTTEYVMALLRRRDAREGMPREEEYCPKGSWDANLKYTPEPSCALRGYLVAVMVDDDNAPLAQSAGAELLAIHEEAPSSSKAEFDSWWKSRTGRAIADGLAVVVIDSSSKRCKHFRDWLKQDGNVRYTNAKNIAKAITNNNGEGELLMDVDKEVIDKVVRVPPPPARPEVTAPTVGATVDQSCLGDAMESSHEPTENEISFQLNGNYDDVPVGARRKRPQVDESVDNAKHVERDQEQRDRQKRRRKDQDEDAFAAEMDRVEVEVRAEGSVTSKTSNAPVNNLRETVVHESSDDEPGLPAERMSLPTTDDGWLVAAPKKRKAFRKDRDEEFVADEDVPDSAAETERLSGLIVREYVQSTKGSRGSGDRPLESANRKRKDFKRFRKNNVLLGYTTFNINGSTNQNHSNVPRIHLVDVLPKESARQLLLQQQQENLEREEELADHLFSDGRKHGGGNMLSYLSQSTTSRGRGRR